MKIKLVDYITEKAHDKKIEDLALLLTSFLDYITGCSVANTELKNLGGGIEGFVSDYIRFKTYARPRRIRDVKLNNISDVIFSRIDSEEL